MSTDIFANFTALDELIQVVYQGIYKFVVVSTVTDDRWTVYVGLSDSAGRWWTGSWSENDVHDILGSKASDSLLEQFANQLQKFFVSGELYITDWSPAPAAKIKFTLGPAAKRPMHVALEEMTPSQAAEFATGIFLEIALQAQSRKCHLHGGDSAPFETNFAVAPSPSNDALTSNREGSSLPSSSSRPKHHGASSLRLLDNDAPEIDMAPPVESGHRKANYIREQARLPSTGNSNEPKKHPPALDKTAAPPIPRSHKGASLANPNKKARKYQAIEFESDSE